MKALIEEFKRELMPLDVPLPLTLSPETRLRHLERRTTELEWVLYGLLGVILFLVFVGRR